MSVSSFFLSSTLPAVCWTLTHDAWNRAGVSGLTTAYLLSQDPANKVTVLAKHMPGDYDIEYASPWAGANYMPYVNTMTRTNFTAGRYLTMHSTGSARKGVPTKNGSALRGQH